MSVPKFLVIEWPKLGPHCYLTRAYSPAWITDWLEREVYSNGHVAYFTEQEPSHAKFRG